MSLPGLPNELLLQVTAGFSAREIHSLVLLNRRLADFFVPILSEFALKEEHSLTALYLAAANRNESMIRFILENGAYVIIVYHSRKEYWTNPRLRPHELEFVVGFLLEQGPAAVILDPTRAFTALNIAVNKKRTRLTQSLLAKGIPRSPPARAYSPLCEPVRDGDEYFVRLLLEHGADPNAHIRHDWCTDDSCCTPLHLATKLGHENIIRLLLEKGANIDIQDGCGYTPLAFAIMGYCNNEGNPPVWDLLIELGANPNITTNDGSTVLHMLADGGSGQFELDEELVKWFLEHGADPEIINRHEERPFQTALTGRSARRWQMAELLRTETDRMVDIRLQEERQVRASINRCSSS